MVAERVDLAPPGAGEVPLRRHARRAREVAAGHFALYAFEELDNADHVLLWLG